MNNFLGNFAIKGLLDLVKTYVKVNVLGTDYDVPLQQIKDSLIKEPTYKVFTALLTQSGGGDIYAITSGNVEKGITYKILGDGGNFSNVGASNNNNGTYFVAINNEIPITFGEAELEYNAGAPEVTVLENTIGNVWFTYDANGQYNINSDGLFTLDKTYSTPYYYNSLGNLPNGIFIENIDINSLQIISMFNLASEDGQLLNTSIEIRVYN
jgi:hypothetical protein